MPAAIRIAPPAIGVTLIELEIIAVRASNACPMVAKMLKTLQTNMYPAANIDACHNQAVPRPRAMRAYISTIGLALGIIIATIITAHIMNTSQRSTHREGSGAVSRAAKAPRSADAIGIRTR